MMELIFTTSRAGAEAFSWKGPFAAISITDPGAEPAVLRQPNLVANCRLEFWDLAHDPRDGREIFDAAMAKRVLDFVERESARVDLLLVHCEAGISRSAGMANAIGTILRLEVHHQNELFVSPNPRVVRLLVEEAMIRKISRQPSELDRGESQRTS